MRADRLVATLLLLQARGTVTAREVADELEVSERTARRDLDALAVSGVPVYSKQGRGGGWTLVGGATTDLTGLRSPEARALMTMAAVSGHAGADFDSAVRKLAQALPEPVRHEAERAMAGVLGDDASWRQPASLQYEPKRTEWIEPLQRAGVERRRVRLAYTSRTSGPTVRVVEPLGTVLKRGDWFVFAGTASGSRTFRVDRIDAAEVLDERFEPPDDFDLDAAWRAPPARYAAQSSSDGGEKLVQPEADGARRTPSCAATPTTGVIERPWRRGTSTCSHHSSQGS